MSTDTQTRHNYSLEAIGHTFGESIDRAMRAALSAAGVLNRTTMAAITYADLAEEIESYGLEDGVFEQFVKDTADGDVGMTEVVDR